MAAEAGVFKIFGDVVGRIQAGSDQEENEDDERGIAVQNGVWLIGLLVCSKDSRNHERAVASNLIPELIEVLFNDIATSRAQQYSVKVLSDIVHCKEEYKQVALDAELVPKLREFVGQQQTSRKKSQIKLTKPQRAAKDLLLEFQINLDKEARGHRTSRFQHIFMVVAVGLLSYFYMDPSVRDSVTRLLSDFSSKFSSGGDAIDPDQEPSG